MELNALFPTRDIGDDPAKVRDWAQAAEELGYATIEVPDHVFGTSARDGWTPTYDETIPFHETFVVLGFLAAVTTRVRLSSSVLILPQRQTGVVAKQAAEVDLLSRGRLRLGVGVGWNFVEYQALGTEWRTRGARQEEQVEVLRRLWSEDLVTFQGRFHELDRVSIAPAPSQRPIPIWFGGSSDAAVRRAGRIGDGWMPIIAPEDAPPKLELLYRSLERAGRDRSSFGLEGWLRVAGPDPRGWAAATDAWRQLGADQVMLFPMYRTPSFDEQIETLRRFKDVAG